jgi:small subunit ribosomal protein S8
MALNNPVATAMSKIMNAENAKKLDVTLYPVSKIMERILGIMKKFDYIDDFKRIKYTNGDKIVVSLSGKINKCGAISPNISIQIKDFEKFEKRYLPAKDFGMLIVSAPIGLITHYEAKEKNTGGKLIAYCY